MERLASARDDASRGHSDAPAQRWRPGELRWAAIAAGLIMVFTCLPYLFGLYLRQPGWYYSGLLANPDEHNVYLSYIRQARDGHLLFFDLFTTEAQRGTVNVFWLCLGLAARITRLPLVIMYHLARVMSGWLLLMAIYWLAAQVMPNLSGRRLALLLVAFASGFGWLFHAEGGQPHPVDYGPGLVMPEVITFLSLLLNPLFCFSMFLMVVILGLATHAFSSGSLRSAALAGLAALVLGNIHTYDLIPVAVVLAAYLVYLLSSRRAGPRALWLALLMAAISAPSVVYQYWLLSAGEPTLVAKTVGQWDYSRGPRYLALGLGLPLLLSLLGAARAAWRGSPDASRLLALWLVLGFALVYLPVSFHRKLAEGLHIPVCLLAASGLELLWAERARRAVAVGALLVVLTIPSNVLFVRRALGDLVSNNSAYVGNLMPPLYLRPDQRTSLQRLDQVATGSDVLLANSFLASYAPSLAGVRVYLGHWSETLDYVGKIKEFSDFVWAGTPDPEREAFCGERGISLLLRDRSGYDDVFLPPGARAGETFDPDGSPWLSRVYRQDLVSLYRAQRP